MMTVCNDLNRVFNLMALMPDLAHRYILFSSYNVFQSYENISELV